jgi:uncharacterized protein (DUF1697 family)
MPLPEESRVKRSVASAVHVALLRGVNVGGKNKLPMRELAEIFGAVGCADVRTYIQSGNVVFAASAGVVKRVSTVVPKKIREKFGFEPPVVLRSADELSQVAARNPFLRDGTDSSALYVGFLADAPERARIAKLNPDRSPGDRYALHDRNIYMHLVTGAADTKLTTAYFDSMLATTSTFRNWRTVLNLIELTRGR